MSKSFFLGFGFMKEIKKKNKNDNIPFKMYDTSRGGIYAKRLYLI